MAHSPHLIPIDLTTLMVDDLPPVSQNEIARMSIFLEFDTWTVEQALCLLCRIDPEASDIDWEFKQRNGSGVAKPTIKIISFQSFSENQPIDTVPDADSIGRSEDADADVWREKVKEAERSLTDLKRIWDSGPHRKTRYKPEYFIDWAINKGHQIGWLEWALSSARYTHPRNRRKVLSGSAGGNDSDDLHAKSKTTALKLIGGLLISGYKMNIHGRLNGLDEVIQDLNRAGVDLDPETIRSWAKQAAQLIPDPNKK